MDAIGEWLRVVGLFRAQALSCSTYLRSPDGVRRLTIQTWEGTPGLALRVEDATQVKHLRITTDVETRAWLRWLTTGEAPDAV
jgi:hypothetical protein